MNRRGFLGASLAVVGGIFVPKYGQWYRQGSGLWTPVFHPGDLLWETSAFPEGPYEYAGHFQTIGGQFNLPIAKLHIRGHRYVRCAVHLDGRSTPIMRDAYLVNPLPQVSDNLLRGRPITEHIARIGPDMPAQTLVEGRFHPLR